MKILSRTETAQFLMENDRYAILSHRRPDGDTVGSSAALCLGLRKLGKTAHVLENPELSEHYRWLHQGLTKEMAEPGDVIVSVDVASPQMLLPEHLALQESIRLRIDHHFSATSFTECELVDPGSASCAEIVYDVLTRMNVVPDRPIAEAIYVGTATDTGCFRYANTTAHSFMTAAFCAQAGAPVYELNQYLFENNTLGRLRMQAWIVDNIRLLPCGMAVCAIPKAVEERLGVTEDDMDNISSFPRSIAGVKMAATLREIREGVKLSVRAVPGMDATVVTGVFGGGGHKGAAGATLRMSLEDAAEAVAQAMAASL